MARLQGLIARVLGLFDALQAGKGGIFFPKAGGPGHIQHTVGREKQGVAQNGNPFTQGARHQREAHPVRPGLAGQEQGVPGKRPALLIVMGAAQQHPGGRAGQAHGHDPVGMADKAFPGKGAAPHPVFHPVDAAHQAELAPVTAHPVLGLQAPHVRAAQIPEGKQRGHGLDLLLNHQIAQGLVVALIFRGGAQGDFGQALGLMDLAPAQQRAHLFHIFPGVGIDPVAEGAVPEAVLVELDPVHLGSAKDHGAHVTIAQGQRLVPGRGRAFIP